MMDTIIRVFQQQSKLIQKQIMIELFQIINACDTYEDFKKAIYELTKRNLEIDSVEDNVVDSNTSMADDSFLI